LSFAARTFFAAVAVCAAGAAHAADLPSYKMAAPDPAPVPPDWIVTVSGQVRYSPAYPGARNYAVFGNPGVSLRRVGQKEAFSTPDEGFSLAFYGDSLVRFGAVGRLLGDRSARGNSALRGLPYVPYSLEIGGFAELTPVDWARLRVELRQAVTGHDGLVATVGGDVWQSWNRFTLSVGPRLYFGSARYAQTFFSVTPAQAALNNALGGALYAYNATGGLTAAGATVALRYDVNEAWRATGYVNYQRLTGSVANSPLAYSIGNGDRNQWTYGLGLAYSFKVGNQIIPGLF
jgi:outer membrane protein